MQAHIDFYPTHPLYIRAHFTLGFAFNNVIRTQQVIGIIPGVIPRKLVIDMRTQCPPLLVYPINYVTTETQNLII